MARILNGHWNASNPQSAQAALRLLLCGLTLLAAPAAVRAEPLADLQAAVPQRVEDCVPPRVRQLAEASEQLEQWAADRAWAGQPETPQVVLQRVARLVETKQQVDRSLNELLSLRTAFVELPEGQPRRQALRQYLTATAQMIDLSGRLRYLLRDAIDNATVALDPHPEKFDELLELLSDKRVGIGATVMAYVLFDPPADSPAEPYPAAVKAKALRLIALTRQADVLALLAEFVTQPQTPPELVVMAAEAIRRVGLPQDPRPGQDPTLPAPAITARQLADRLSQVDARRLLPAQANRHRELMAWLNQRIERGVAGPRYRVGHLEVQAGDWLLMRNPSPYNMFIDLAPGLFTHVGVVAIEQDEQGRRRFVIVDLPEEGNRIPATNVEIYLQRTLHYAFVRHRDTEVGERMGQVAAQLIGNPSQFDLTFRTDRVPPLKGQPLEGTRIHTYCAGFLLLCAQETGREREEFFPIAESPAGGNCLDNLGKLGLSIGEDFISPTGAIFSPHLELAGRRAPLYSPGREIKEAIYDHFAHSMITRELTPSPDLRQALRQKLARLSKLNPWLARTLARAHNVSEHLDLEAAAKAAAVIETLDEIADANRDGFFEARQSLLVGPLEALAQAGWQPEQLDQVRHYRQQHAELYRQWTERQLTPRQLRVELVRYYKQQGTSQLDERFFPES